MKLKYLDKPCPGCGGVLDVEINLGQVEYFESLVGIGIPEWLQKSGLCEICWMGVLEIREEKDDLDKVPLEPRHLAAFMVHQMHRLGVERSYKKRSGFRCESVFETDGEYFDNGLNRLTSPYRQCCQFATKQIEGYDLCNPCAKHFEHRKSIGEFYTIRDSNRDFRKVQPFLIYARTPSELLAAVHALIETTDFSD